jgi:hypothetical protein
VLFTPQDDGTCELWALLGADAAATLKSALDHAADTNAGLDERSADQRRADALTDLALNALAAPGALAGAGAGRGVRPAVNVTVALSTLLGLDQQPGELDGHGPIPAALARAIAFDTTGTWRRLLTDPTGRLIETGATTYRPPTATARHVRAQHPTCRFPGCRHPAPRCHLDHITAWTHGGTTHPDNLQPLCPRHHHLKHDTGWQVHRDPDNTTHWRSPSGHTYPQPPDPLPLDTTTASHHPNTDPPPF